MPKERLAQQFKDIFGQKPEADVVIKADRRLKYKEVRDVMRLLNEAGYSGVGLVAEKKESG
ncbi:biopolymer transport protein ExbD [compost metagenome]